MGAEVSKSRIDAQTSGIADMGKESTESLQSLTVFNNDIALLKNTGCHLHSQSEYQYDGQYPITHDGQKSIKLTSGVRWRVL